MGRQDSICRVIDACRSCGFGQLTDIFSLGNLYVSNFVDDQSSQKDERPYPLEVVLCDASKGGCALLQLRHTVSPKKMYSNYWYRSGVNQTMVSELTNIARTAEKIASLSVGDIALDIGCNDGTLLRAYEAKGVHLAGFEPARNLIAYAREGTSKIFNDLFSYRRFCEEFGKRRAKVITAIAMFYDLDDPNTFVDGVFHALEPEGVFIIQMSYLPSMLAQNAFDNICHEHLEYYSLLSLENLLARHHLELFDGELNDVNGGSFRTYIRHVGSRVGEKRRGRETRLEKLRTLESNLALNKRAIYDQFVSRIYNLGDALRGFIKAETEEGKKIYIYGASTKGNTLLQFFQLDSVLIKAAAERNPMKWGRKTIGTNIPIISEEQARQERPEYFLVLPWHFLPEFLEREKDYLRSGGKFIVPLPEFKVIGANDI